MNKLIDKYLNTLEKQEKKYVVQTSLNTYLKWRKITVEQLIQNDLAEEIYLEKYLQDNFVKVKPSTRIIRVSNIKQFLRFHGVNLPKYQQKSIGLYFKNDGAMIDFLVHVGNTESTKKEANRSLYYYCQFRNKTPTELIDEVVNLTDRQIRSYILTFYESKRKLKSSWTMANNVRRFYQFVADRIVILPKNKKDKTGKRIFSDENQILVDKEMVKKLLKFTDLRDSMVILALFDSGINQVDLVKLNYGDLKQYLNLENPQEINDVAVIQYERQKTKKFSLAGFGKDTLQRISLWLNYCKKQLAVWGEELTDDFPLISQKTLPFKRLSEDSIYSIVTNASQFAGYTQKISNSDFRNSFNTRAKAILKHYDKELFMGHSGGIERHYDISTLEYFTNEYRKAWEILFDLSYDHERILSVEEENREIKAVVADLTNVVEGIYQGLHDKDGDFKLTKNDIEKALLRAKQLR